MAAELGKFLSEKLRRLPHNHPDRNFLEGIYRTTRGYIEKKSSVQEVLIPSREEIQGMDLVMLGKSLRERRIQLGMPQAVVARRAKINRNTVWIVEKTENPKTKKPSRISKDKLERWLNILGVSPEERRDFLTLAGYTEEI